MFLLDTDILSNLIRRSPSPVLIAKLASIPGEQLFTSSITLGEMVYGAYRRDVRTQSLLTRIEQVLLYSRAILPFDDDAARSYGALRAELERLGTPLADADLRIASIALARNLTVITGNVRHFNRVPGLTVENWLE
jgi:predicted nucleic acid-binding protein